MKNAVFDIHGIKVRMEYRKIKNMNLYVRPEQGEVLVTVPFRTPRERVELRVPACVGGADRKNEKAGFWLCPKVGDDHGRPCVRLDPAGYEDKVGKLYCEHGAYPAEYQTCLLSGGVPRVCDRARALPPD